VFETSSDDISDKNSSDGSSTASDEPQEGVTSKGMRDQQSEHDDRANYQYVNIYN